VNLVVAVINRIPIRRAQWPFVLTHFSIVLLLFGCWISRTYGYEGRLFVQEGQETRYIYQDGDEVRVDWWHSHDAEGATEVEEERSASFPLVRRSENSSRELQTDGVDQPGVRVLRQIKSGVASRELRPSDDTGAAGVEFIIGNARGRSHQWLFTGEPRLRRIDLGPVEVELIAAPSQDFFEILTSAKSTAPDAHLVIHPGAGVEPIRIPLPDGVGTDVPLGDGRIAHVGLFAPHGKVKDGRLSEAPGTAINPGVEVEIRAGDRSERHTAFANYPDYRTSHSEHAGEAKDPLIEKLTLEAGKGMAKPLLTLVLGPDGLLYLAPQGQVHGEKALPLPVGQSVRLARIGADLEATRILPNATTENVVSEASAEQAGARPWVELEVSHAGEHERVWLSHGATSHPALAGRHLTLSYGQQRRAVPFVIALHEFKVTNHPGSNRPAEFSSLVDVKPLETGEPPRRVLISMNKPLDQQGFRLFQSSYQLGTGDEADTTILSVSYDPGVAVVYPSFVLLIIGIAWYVQRNSGRVPQRMTLTSPPRAEATPTIDRASQTSLRSSVGMLFTCLLAFMAASAAPAHAAGDSAMPVEETAGWAILADGRIKPLLTYAEESALSVTGRQRHDGLRPLDFLWGYVLSPEDFKMRPYIRVDSLALKEHLGLPSAERRFSFDALMANPKFRPAVTAALAAQSEERDLDQLQKGALDAYAKLNRVAGLMDTNLLSIVPIVNDDGSWTSPSSLRDSDDPRLKGITEEFMKLSSAYQKADVEAFRQTARGIGEALREFEPDLYPSAATIDRELFSERFNAFGKAWKLYLCAALFMLVLGFIENRWIHRTAIALLALGFVAHTTGLGLRWAIAGRAPVSDMYESLVFMGWGITAIALVQEAVHRNRFFALTGALMGFLCLAFSENLPIDSNISPLVPVLAHTSWLAIHVMTIMISYSAFALAMAMAHVALIFQMMGPQRNDRLTVVSILTYKTLQVGLLFLGAGIICGAVWANESWGRYWGWDPKETWSLITFFIYLAIIHARHAGWLWHFGLAASSILGFLSVIMTYYGVNYILAAGMHSYGFSEGGQLYMGLFAGFEIALVAAAYLRRRMSVRPEATAA
jgi:cytochrome c-type biogenesis protein CcsB